MKENLNTTQKIFLVWFIILSFMATYNFYTNVTDARRHSALENDYLKNKQTYADSIREHEVFREKHAYFEGVLAGKCGLVSKD